MRLPGLRTVVVFCILLSIPSWWLGYKTYNYLRIHDQIETKDAVLRLLEKRTEGNGPLWDQLSGSDLSWLECRAIESGIAIHEFDDDGKDVFVISQLDLFPFWGEPDRSDILPMLYHEWDHFDRERKGIYPITTKARKIDSIAALNPDEQFDLGVELYSHEINGKMRECIGQIEVGYPSKVCIMAGEPGQKNFKSSMSLNILLSSHSLNDFPMMKEGFSAAVEKDLGFKIESLSTSETPRIQ